MKRTLTYRNDAIDETEGKHTPEEKKEQKVVTVVG